MALRVLIVDDDKLLVAGMIRILAQFEVSAVGSTDEAIALVTATAFDAVLTDYRVPTSNGLGLLRKVAELRPATRRYLMSGSGPEGFVEHVASALVHRMFPKPIDVKALRSELASLAGDD